MFPVKYINVKFSDGITKLMHPKKAYELWFYCYMDHLYNMWDILEHNSISEKIEFSDFCRWVFTSSDKYLDINAPS